MRKFTLGIALALVIGASLSAQAYLLRYKDVAGMARTYQTTVNIKGSMTVPGLPAAIPLVMVMSFTAREKVQSVNADGTATILSEMKDGSITANVNGQEQKQPFPAIQMTYDRTPVGKVSNLKMHGDGAAMKSFMGGPNFMSQLGQGYQFPEGEVKVSDTWKLNQALEVMPGMKFNIGANFTLNSAPVYDGKTYLNVVTDMTMTMPKSALQLPAGTAGAGGTVPGAAMAMKMTMKGASLFDAAGGFIYSSAFNGVLSMQLWMTDPQSGQATQAITNMNMDGTMKLVKEEHDGVWKAPATPAPAL